MTQEELDRLWRDLAQVKQFLEKNGLQAYANSVGVVLQRIADGRFEGQG